MVVGSNPTSATKLQLRRWYRKEKKKRGRPKKYTEVEKLQLKIDEYFEDCEKNSKPLSLSGLAFALNMDRKTLLNYSKEEEFFPTIKRARDRVETYVEERLFFPGATAGVIFNLKNNFGWKDKQEVDTTSTNRIQIINDLSSDVDET